MSGARSPSATPHDLANEVFQGYRWHYFTSLGDGQQQSRVQMFIQSTDWEALIEYATRIRNGETGKLLPNIGLGYNHMVRIIEFHDVQWIARLRMQPLSESQNGVNTTESMMSNEYETMMFIRKKTSILVPDVHAVEPNSQCSVKAQVMLMDCLRGNAGIDLDMEIPSCHKDHVFAQIAKVQVFYSPLSLTRYLVIFHC